MRVKSLTHGDRKARHRSETLTEAAVRAWAKQTDLDSGARTDRLTNDERSELRALRAEHRRLTQDVDILKRATAFFAIQMR